MNIDYKKEFITCLKADNKYLLWRQRFSTCGFEQAPHLFFQYVKPYDYIKLVNLDGYYIKSTHIKWLEYLIKCNPEWKTLIEEKIKNI